MEESKFEKQVKDKMDDLKIQPSEAVWIHIKAGIQEKKRSHWLIVFLFFFLIMGAGFLIWNSMQPNVPVHQKHFAKNILNKITYKQTPAAARDTALHTNNNILLKKKNDNVVLFNKTMAIRKKDNLVRPYLYRKNIATSLIKYETHPGKQATVINSENIKKNENDIIKIGDKTSISTTELKQPYNKHPALAIESSHDSTFKNNQSNTIINKKDTSHKPIVSSHNLNKNKWKLGFMLTSGVSSVSNNSFNSNNTSYSSAYPLPQNTQGSGTNAYYSSSTHPGFGFITGLFAEKNITNKTSLSAGINYVSYTVSNALSDSVLIYYAAKHIDHFTFVQLPFLVKWKINNSTKIPLLLQGGITLSTLVNTGVLKNKSFYNTTQAGLNASLLAGLFSIQKHQVLIGPYYYYSIAKMANKGLYYNKHLSFAGLSGRIIFK